MSSALSARFWILTFTLIMAIDLTQTNAFVQFFTKKSCGKVKSFFCAQILIKTLSWCRECELETAIENSSHNNDQWNYTRPEQWADIPASVCGSKLRQSPIDIIIMKPEKRVNTLRLLRGHYPSVEGKVTKENRSIYFTLNDPTLTSLCNVQGSNEDDTYVLHSFHLHWGRSDSEGSEHTMNGVASSLEIHFVHYLMSYGNLSEAKKHKDGVVVIAALFDARRERNISFDPIVSAIPHLSDTGIHVSLSPGDLLPSSYQREYSIYDGSLTTPMCDEVVTWIVATQIGSVSSGQLAALRAIEPFNFRPVQPLGERKVRRRIQNKR